MSLAEVAGACVHAGAEPNRTGGVDGADGEGPRAAVKGFSLGFEGVDLKLLCVWVIIKSAL